MGGRPKSLLEMDGTALIKIVVDALRANAVDPIIVVLGHHAGAIQKILHDLPVTPVLNPSPDDGQFTSLRIGLQAVPHAVDAVIVALADQPMITATDIADLIQEVGIPGAARMVVPRIDGQPGNPVVIDAALRDEWLAGEAKAAGQAWRKANPTRVHWLDTSNDHYRVDIDTPEDVAQFAARTGHTLCWPHA